MPSASIGSDQPVVRVISPVPAPSGRVAWVDVSRVLVMLGTVLAHTPVDDSWKSLLAFTSPGRMCLLFTVAGYFMARRCTPGVLFPHWGRAVRMAAAYALLVCLYMIPLGWSFEGPRPGEGFAMSAMRFLLSLVMIADNPPVPLWFLRDLLLLTLACSLFAWLGKRRMLYPLILLCLLLGLETSSSKFELGGWLVTHPRSVAFFALGMALTNISLANVAAWLKRWSLLLAPAALGLVIFERGTLPVLEPLGIVAYMTLSLIAALWLERVLPALARGVARFGETVFFVYVLHLPVLKAIELGLSACSVDAARLPSGFWLALVPVVYLAVHALGMAIKRCSPELFGILAIRPPKHKSVASAGVPRGNGALQATEDSVPERETP